jgi:hypothetical protein
MPLSRVKHRSRSYFAGQRVSHEPLFLPTRDGVAAHLLSTQSEEGTSQQRLNRMVQSDSKLRGLTDFHFGMKIGQKDR